MRQERLEAQKTKRGRDDEGAPGARGRDSAAGEEEGGEDAGNELEPAPGARDAGVAGAAIAPGGRGVGVIADGVRVGGGTDGLVAGGGGDEGGKGLERLAQGGVAGVWA